MMCPNRTPEVISMKPLELHGIHCCRGCTSRSIEPNCHGYCPTYLAERLERDMQLEENHRRSSVAHGIDDTRWNSYERRKRRRKRGGE